MVAANLIDTARGNDLFGVWPWWHPRPCRVPPAQLEQ